METLTAEQQEALVLFREVTASGDEAAARQLLRSCDWNVEQAVQLHLAQAEGEHAAAARPAAAGAHRGLAAPLLAGPGAGGDIRPVTNPAPPQGQGSSASLAGWVLGWARRIGSSLFGLFRAFLFGAGTRIGGATSGAAFRQSLTNTYGDQLVLPQFFEGSFSQALRTAQRDLKLLVVFLHSEHSREARNFLVDVLSNEFVRTMLDESFLLWGGDIARMESHHVSQMIHARQYPCFCVLLPASVDEVRAIGVVQGAVQVDAAISLLAACFEEMETHRSEIAARSAQHVEDRSLREEQDREYQEALEMDRKLGEEREARAREAREAERAAEEERRKQVELQENLEAERRKLDEERAAQALTLAPEGPDATARIALRLPTGQRAQRKFRPDAPLSQVYAWASCVGHLPESKGSSIQIPRRFSLKLAFPTRELTEMDSTIQELQLSGANLLLAEIEDDD